LALPVYRKDPVTLAHLTDQQRASLLRTICAEFGLNYDAVDEDTLLYVLHSTREHAERYVDLCR